MTSYLVLAQLCEHHSEEPHVTFPDDRRCPGGVITRYAADQEITINTSVLLVGDVIHALREVPEL